MKANKRHFQSKSWLFLSFGIAGLVLTPILVVLGSWLLPVQMPHWQHLMEHLLLSLVWQTGALLVGVCLLTFLIGVTLAWLCSQYRFPGSAWLKRGLILPFAIPAYVSAFVFVGLLDYSGPLRTGARIFFGSDAWIPEIRSLPGGIFILSLALFPYVYVLSFDAFSTQGRSSLEAARSLGSSSFSVFYRLAISFARPWIAGALCLVSLEVLNDFGTVSIVGVNSFTTAIYKVWFGFFSPTTAAQLSSFLVILAFLIFYVEQRSRQGHRYTSSTNLLQRQGIPLRGMQALGASFYALTVFVLAFLLPLAQLLVWVFMDPWAIFSLELAQILFHSLVLGILAASLATLAALIVCLAARYVPRKSLRRSQQIAQLGYGIPGSVMAIGIFLVMVRIDHGLVGILEKLFDYTGPLLLTGTILSMVVALGIRFLAVASSSIDAGLTRISTRLDEVGQLYGTYGWQQFRLIHWPLLKGSIASGFFLVFVDVIKEMPLTLMTRPFGWDSLSVRIYGLTSEGEWQRAALPALCLVLIGMIPLFLFQQKRS